MVDKLLTLEEVSKYLRLHRMTIYRLAQRKRIPASKVGRVWRFRKQKIEQWLDEQNNPGKHKRKRASNRGRKKVMGTLATSNYVEKRKSPRAAVKIPLKVRQAGFASRVLNARAVDLSEGGVRLSLPDNLKLPKNPILEFTLPKALEDFKVYADIVWNNRRHYGLQFKDLEERQAMTLKRILWQWGHPGIEERRREFRQASSQKMIETYNELRKENLWLYYNDYEPGESPVKVLHNNKEHLLFSTNNYLGLSHSPKIVEAAVKVAKKCGVGSGASLAVTGATPTHKALEEKLAKFYGYESALVLASGYLANSAVISALADNNTVALCDKFLHKSFFNACKLNDVEYIRFRHNDPVDLEKKIVGLGRNKKVLIVSESVFSQHGGISKIDLLSEISRRYNATLIVDDAHALGTIGKTGRGILEHYNMNSDAVDIITGAMNKSLGSQGGYILAKKAIIDLVEERASELIFTSSLPAMSMAAAHAALEEIEGDGKLVAKLRENIIYCRNCLQDLGIRVPEDVTPIIPIVIGDEKETCRISKALKEEGIIAMPIIPPGVPEGASRIRIQITSEHKKDDIDKLASALKNLMERATDAKFITLNF